MVDCVYLLCFHRKMEKRLERVRQALHPRVTSKGAASLFFAPFPKKES
jgi:hypothetical protein